MQRLCQTSTQNQYQHLIILLATVGGAELCAAIGCYAGAYGPPTPRVLLVHAESQEGVSDVKGTLIATGDFAVVESFDASVGSPSAPLLAEYDIALVE